MGNKIVGQMFPKKCRLALTVGYQVAINQSHSITVYKLCVTLTNWNYGLRDTLGNPPNNFFLHTQHSSCRLITAVNAIMQIWYLNNKSKTTMTLLVIIIIFDEYPDSPHTHINEGYLQRKVGIDSSESLRGGL